VCRSHIILTQPQALASKRTRRHFSALSNRDLIEQTAIRFAYILVDFIGLFHSQQRQQQGQKTCPSYCTALLACTIVWLLTLSVLIPVKDHSANQ
jgi:hypothetical protein